MDTESDNTNWVRVKSSGRSVPYYLLYNYYILVLDNWFYVERLLLNVVISIVY